MNGVGTQKHGLMLAPVIEQAIGKHMAPVRVRTQLNFVDGGERKGAIGGHAFHGGEEIFSPPRHDFFFAGDQGDLVGTLDLHRPVIIFTRQQSQRKTDNAGRMAEHALHSQVGLAGVGGA